MSNLLQIVARTICSHRLLPEAGAVIVALSGGADSVALLAALIQLGYQCTAAHCNFHLRGDESDRDQAAAEAAAKRLGCPCRVEHFNVAQRCQATGESVEMACRSLRYQWFEQLSAEYNAAVAVAHHRQDLSLIHI